jgi:hypothetical protein
MRKLTPWFKPIVKPVNAGVYQTKIMDKWAGTYSYWNGSEWCVPEKTLSLAYQNRYYKAVLQMKQWRGLAVKHAT